MKINNELLLMYSLGRVSDPELHDYIAAQLEADPDVAARFRHLTDVEDMEAGEAEESPVSRETCEALDYFFPWARGVEPDQAVEDARPPKTALAVAARPGAAGPLDVTVRNAWGAAASQQATSPQDAAERPYNCPDLKRRIIDFRHPETNDRCQHGVVLARIYESRASATCVGAVLIPIAAVDGQLRGQASIDSILAEHPLTSQAKVEFWDDKETIYSSCSRQDLLEVAGRADLTASCREKIQTLIAEMRNDGTQ